MLDHTTLREDDLVESTKNVVFLSLEKQVHIALDATLSESVIKGILDHIHQGVRHELELHQMKMTQSPWVTSYKEADKNT